MTSPKLIHAFTNPGSDAPPYINISRMEDGSVRVIVRGKPYPNHMSGTEEIALSEADWRSLVWSSFAEANDHEKLASRAAAAPLSDAQIKHMVDRFLQWKVPADFSPDGGVKFEPNRAAGGGFHRPVGTNLLTATQAEAMIRQLVADVPS